MKKIIILLLVLVPFLAACGSTETTMSQEELKAELKAQIKAELEAEANQAQETQQENIDLRNEDILLDFIYEKYDIQLDKNILKDSMTTTYGDYNNDGIEDVVYYSKDSDGFYEVPFITVKDGSISLIPSDIESGAIHSQKVEFDGKFIHYTVTGGGTGISTTVKTLYVFNGSKISDTGASLTMGGYAANPPDYSTETEGITALDNEGDYTSFTHEVITTGSEESYEKYRYLYNPERYSFTVTDITE